MKKAKPQERGPIVVVQWLEVEWGKLARGAEAATIRNQLPKALPLPELMLRPESQIIVQHIAFADFRGFEPQSYPLEEAERPSLPRLPGIELTKPDGQLIATLKQEMKWTDVYRPQIIVPFGSWCQLTWNERVVHENTWRYKQTVLNIGYFSHYDSNAFLAQPSIAERSDLRPLY
ncbi:hypothetical protein [Deinococcus sp.]|uniref:hypothetical protein n=1 Tax=Deinococcus sp. TaxID=47478 RepID=UPI003CC62B6E